VAFVGAEKFSEFYITLHYTSEISITAGSKMSNINDHGIQLITEIRDAFLCSLKVKPIVFSLSAVSNETIVVSTLQCL